MFGLGFTEILIIALIAFLVFGPQKFPAVIRNFMKLLNELKSTVSDVQSEFHDLEKEVQEEFDHFKGDIKPDPKLLEQKKTKPSGKKEAPSNTLKKDDKKEKTKKT